MIPKEIKIIIDDGSAQADPLASAIMRWEFELNGNRYGSSIQVERNLTPDLINEAGALLLWQACDALEAIERAGG